MAAVNSNSNIDANMDRGWRHVITCGVFNAENERSGNNIEGVTSYVVQARFINMIERFVNL